MIMILCLFNSLVFVNLCLNDVKSYLFVSFNSKCRWRNLVKIKTNLNSLSRIYGKRWNMDLKRTKILKDFKKISWKSLKRFSRPKILCGPRNQSPTKKAYSRILEDSFDPHHPSKWAKIEGFKTMVTLEELIFLDVFLLLLHTLGGIIDIIEVHQNRSST